VPSDLCLTVAAEALVADQQSDGGWGYHKDVPTDADSTAYVLTFLARQIPHDPSLHAGGQCLLRHQDLSTGGVATYREPKPILDYMKLPDTVSVKGWCSPHLEVTAAAGRAFAMLPDMNTAAEAAWRFVERQQQSDGSWFSYWWTLPHYPTYQAVALGKALPHVAGTEAAVRRAVEWIINDQSPDGGWAPVRNQAPTPFATALGVAILTETGEPLPALRKGVTRLAEMQLESGGWASYPVLRVPPPDTVEPDRHQAWRFNSLGTGVVIRDQNQLYCTATCLGALAKATRCLNV